MANTFRKNAADRKAEQKKIEKAVAELAAIDALAVAHGERQEGAQDDGCGTRDDDCRNHPRVDSGAS